MASRDELHRLVDQLPPEHWEQVKGYLTALARRDPLTAPDRTMPPLQWQGDAPPPTTC
jgi:hypothetical protein